MKPIKFRGKSIETGEWSFGHFLTSNISDTTWYIVADVLRNKLCRIDPATLCQFTGLTDCNGTDMWEGDVVNGLSDKHRYEIRFDGLEFYFMHCWLKDYAGEPVRWGLLSRGIEVFNEYKVPLCVIGNRFDNPELLEVQP